MVVITLKPFSPKQLERALADGKAVLIDVREAAEHAAERIEGAVLHPLSKFDPKAIAAAGKDVVLHCGVGRRSEKAAALCRKAGVAIAGHLEGGLAAWKAAGLPVIRGR